MDADRAAVLRARADIGAARPGPGRRYVGRPVDELSTSWLLLDAELLPWSAKAGQLLRDQYASVGAAARAALPVAVSVLERAAERLSDASDLALAVSIG